jgi:diguanylate cyclase (GGDEF)-like protein/PAS domain S-box-containing protein
MIKIIKVRRETMAWILPSVILMASSALMVMSIFFYLYHQYREQHIKIWAMASFCLALGPIFTLLSFQNTLIRLGILGEEIAFLAAAGFLLDGIYIFLNKKMPDFLKITLLLTSIWIGVHNFIPNLLISNSLPVYIVITGLFLYAGYVLFRNWRFTGIGGIICGWVLIIAGVSLLDYLFLRKNSWFGSWGYLITTISITTCLIDILLFYFQKVRHDLSQSEARYRFMAENARDIVYRLQIVPELKYEFISSAVFEITGYTPEEHYQDPNIIFTIVHPNYLTVMKQIVTGEFDYRKPLSFPWRHRNGQIVWIEQYIHPVTDNNGIVYALEGIARNVTERVEMEEQLKYMSMRDSLSGVYNRTFFEQACLNFDTDNYNPLGIILCDIDGLKLINDTLGHDAGDWLLLAAAWSIQESFRENDVIARIGGDEFAIILPKTPAALVEQSVKRIEKAVQSYNSFGVGVHLSMSIGFACRNDSNITMADLFKNADNNMYREKLYRSKSVRSTIVNTLMKTLEARDVITEEHMERLQDTAVKLAIAVGFPENRLTDLRLLAQFHDIGKVGIPDRILLKPGKLTAEEMLEMQRHSEIGYRIAQSSPDLVPVADLILRHHEWWNGNGYPLKLKGEEIPIECRISAIVDAFDAMINERPYRKALPWEEALMELRKGAGIQFDPYLVEQFAKLINTRDRIIDEPGILLQ